MKVVIRGLEDHSEEFRFQSMCEEKSFKVLNRGILVIHSFSTYLLNAYYIPGNVLSAGETVLNKRHKKL